MPLQRALPSRQDIAAPIRIGAKGQGYDEPVSNRHCYHWRGIGMSRSAADVVHDRIHVAARERQDKNVRVYKRRAILSRDSIDAERGMQKRNIDHRPLRSGNRGHMQQWRREGTHLGKHIVTLLLFEHRPLSYA